MIKQLLNSVIAKYRDLSVSARHRKITIFCSTSSNNCQLFSMHSEENKYPLIKFAAQKYKTKKSSVRLFLGGREATTEYVCCSQASRKCVRVC